MPEWQPHEGLNRYFFRTPRGNNDTDRIPNW